MHNHASFSAQTVCKLLANSSYTKTRQNGVQISICKPLLRSGKLASWLIIRVASSFMHNDLRSRPDDILSSVWADVLGSFCRTLNDIFLTCEGLTGFCGILWILSTKYIPGKQATRICIANAKRESLFRSFTTWHSLSLSLTSDLIVESKIGVSAICIRSNSVSAQFALLNSSSNRTCN